MPSRAMRIVVSLSMLSVLLGASVAQAAPGAPGSPFGTPPGQLISGKLSIAHGDSFGFTGPSHPQDPTVDHVLPDTSYWLLTDAGEELQLEFPGTPPVASPGGYYEVRGQRNGRSFQVAEMKEQDARPSGGGGKGGPKGQTPTSYVGARDMIVIPFTFAGNPTPLTDSRETIRDRGFGPRSVRTFYEESSATTSPGLTFKGKNDGTAADKDGLPGDVTETFSISGATDRCDPTGWASSARSAATAAGWDLTGYEHVVFVHPRLTKLEGTEEVSICTYAGRGQIGGTDSWLNGTIDLGVWAHELGHNLTLYHSRTSICSTADGVFISVASNCSFDEYGDPFDTMGNPWTTPRQYHARNKAHLGWVPSANLLSGISGQTYTLRPINSAASGAQVLQIPRGREYLYVEYRRPAGAFDNFAPTDDVVNGALIRSGPATATNGNSYLFDTAIYPTTTEMNLTTGDETVIPDFSDAALNVGEGFVDTVSGVYIETVSVNPDGSITVLVRTGVSNATPELTRFDGTAVGVPGLPHQAPTAELTDANKNLGRYQWSFVSCPGTCPELRSSEGALAGGSDSATGPTYVPTTAGTYELELKVWDTSGAVLRVLLRETIGLL